MIVCDFESIYEVLVTKSADFAGRPSWYLADLITEGQAGIVRTDYGSHLQGRRKLLHMYLKQYGAGMKRLEDVMMDATTDMIQHLVEFKGKPVDINKTLFLCVSDIMAIMLTGETFDKATVLELQQLFKHASIALAKSLSSEIVNRFPFARHFGNSAYKGIMKNVEMNSSLLNKWLSSKPANGLINYMQVLSEEDKRKYGIAERQQQRLVIFDFFAAGSITTSITLTALMNVLCQRRDIQEKLQQEIENIIGDSRAPCLADREKMPYHTATLLEISRFASIAPLSVSHKSMCATTLNSKGHLIHIPAGTEILPHLWSLHHDEEIFPEPFHFDPGRFLDSAGRLIPADHPNRKHVMAFGAGHRVCVGEVFAMSRMFLIVSRLLQTFNILPESTLEAQPSYDPRNMTYGALLIPNVFKVRFEPIQ